jgi:NADPH-dependent curcumin reductase CurA
MPDSINRQWKLARRPKGLLQAEDFSYGHEPKPVPGEGEILIRNLYLSCDPTQRAWFEYDTYLPIIKIGEVVRSMGAGRIEASNHPDYKVGDLVSGLLGWQDYVVIKPVKGAVNRLRAEIPIPLALGALGLTGMTAYVGLLDIGKLKEGETVLVSGAAGATGSVAGQIAKVKGCRVIGIAGGPEKCAWVANEGMFDACIDYKADNVAKKIAELCPTGVDLYFDNVGGAILDAALGKLAMHGRVVICGGISSYNAVGRPPGISNISNLIVKRGKMEGFVILDHGARFPEAARDLMGWIQEGRVKNVVDIQTGLENAPATLNRLFEGKNLGKQLLKIAEA